MSDSWHQNLKNKNRKEIIASARELFLKNNFLSVNIKDVCVLAGVSRVTFYKHFKSIDELIFEIQIDILNNMTEFIVSKDNDKVTGLERLKLIINAWIDFGKEHKDQIKFIVLFDLYYDTFNGNEDLKSSYEDFIGTESHKYFLHSAIEKGIEDKSLRADLDPVKTGYTIFQTIMGVIQRMSYTNLPLNYEGIDFDEIINSVTLMILNSVKSDTAN